MSGYEWSAISLSLKVAAWAIGCSLPIALLLAWLLSRKHFAGKAILESVLHLPLVLPPVVIGYLLLIALAPGAPLGRWLAETFSLSFAFHWRGAALASAVVAMPLMVRAIRQSLDAVDTKLELAARTLGASRTRVFATITLPLAAPGVLAGAILGFARSLGEFGATITFVSNIPDLTRTLPLAMYSFIQTPGAEDQAARLCVIAVVIALVALLLSEWLHRVMRRRLGLEAA